MDIAELVAKVPAAKERLGTARESVGEDVVWYQYDILANLWHLNGLLTGENRDLAQLAAGRPVADIGGADGDLAFMLETELGWRLDLIDTAATNQNGFRAAQLLKRALGSSVEIRDVDLDQQFRLPRDRYGLVLLLGILYHLQNPFYVLRQLAQQADHCIVSTKVARFAGEPQVEIASLPVAYLVSPAETNNDATNYWMFSPAGLERIVDRAGWTVLDRLHAGDVVASDPSSPEHDERMFMLLRSRA